MTTPVDQDARDRIGNDTSTTLFVNAGAGSGKTQALVNRVRTLVLRDRVPLANIAAVTFTERAGAELRERLRVTFEHEQRDQGPGAEQATKALDDLDTAAIGTLHSFAQRILTEHPIEAGLPPIVDVLDEVGSSVAFEERWSELQSESLDDETIERPLLIGLGIGIQLKDLRSLAQLLGRDWDLIEERILDVPDADERFWLPDLGSFLARARGLLDLRRHCTNPDDLLLGAVNDFAALVDRLGGAVDDESRLAALQLMSHSKFSQGVKTVWAGMKDTVAGAGTALADEAGEVVARVQHRCLRALTSWLARKVVEAAQLRRGEGRLEFHDLLVLTRNLLRRNADVRAMLHRDYQRLLLDEFQDTDPIQIEIAARICGGAAAEAAHWQDLGVPAGRLFVVGDAKQSIYRFRRASIATYLEARSRLGDEVELTTNFRTVQPVLAWVNTVFGQLIQHEDGGQPEYVPLGGVRAGTERGAHITVLGADEHQDKPDAADLRTREAADVAGALRRIIDEGWTVIDERTGEPRSARRDDIVVLVPARSSLPFLETALEKVGIPSRAEASSLVYQAGEIRDLLMCARAVADPSDAHALVASLRSPLFGCGDDDLWRWRYNDCGTRRSFSIFAPTENTEATTTGSDEQPAPTDPVATALVYLRGLARAARWLTPSEVLGRIVADRRMLEVAAAGPQARDSWRRIRYVVDQARAWSELSHGGLRAYLAWARHQGQETSRVAESILPETDVDAVRIMTIHAAKGLEFPIVAMSGMTSEPRRQSGVALLWPPDGGYQVKVKKGVSTDEFDAVQPVDEQMDELERLRLLYVGATRARDHLIVSLHRSAAKAAPTAARKLASASVALTSVDRFQLGPLATDTGAPESTVEPPPDYVDWLAGIEAARAAGRVKVAQSASGLEGTEPEVALGHDTDPGSAKGPRNLELPPWAKGRYGSEIGRAVHGVLQVVDLGTGAGLDAAVAAQVVAEGVAEHADLVRALVRSALDSDIVKRAAAREHWRETYVGTTESHGMVLEGYIDLIFREDDGSLRVVDYKTDEIPAGAIGQRMIYYQPQVRAYRKAVTRATGAEVTTDLLFLQPASATAVRVD